MVFVQLLTVSVQERPRGRNGKDGEAEEGSVGPAGRKTLDTLGAADSITEALEMAATEVQRQQVILFCCCMSRNAANIVPLLHTLT